MKRLGRLCRHRVSSRKMRMNIFSLDYFGRFGERHEGQACAPGLRAFEGFLDKHSGNPWTGAVVDEHDSLCAAQCGERSQSEPHGFLANRVAFYNFKAYCQPKEGWTQCRLSEKGFECSLCSYWTGDDNARTACHEGLNRALEDGEVPKGLEFLFGLSVPSAGSRRSDEGKGLPCNGQFWSGNGFGHRLAHLSRFSRMIATISSLGRPKAKAISS